MTDRDVSPWLIRGIYLFGVAFMLTAAIDLFTTVWPMRPTEMTWRYGFLGLAGGYLQTPTLGLLLIAVAAIWDRSVGVLRLTGYASLLLALAFLIAMGVFGLDVVQVRQLRPEDARTAVLWGGIFQEVKYFVAALVLLLIGQGALKTAKASREEWTPSAPGIVSAGRTSAGGGGARRPATQASPVSTPPRTESESGSRGADADDLRGS